jgi:hypothetical protein
VLAEDGYLVEEAPMRRHPDKIRFFERAKSNQLWQADLFTFVMKRQNQRIYLVAFMDDHSPYYQRTMKRRGKTVMVSLSETQAMKMKVWIKNHREFRKITKAIETHSIKMTDREIQEISQSGCAECWTYSTTRHMPSGTPLVLMRWSPESAVTSIQRLRID